MDVGGTGLPVKLPNELMASIIGVALRSSQTPVYFDAAAEAFRKLGREQDATTVTYMRELYAMGEIEILMGMRAQWLGKR